MTLQITPFGLILASPCYLLAAFLLWRAWRRLRASPWRYAVPLLVPVAALLPFADELWIAWRFEQACRDAGVKVYRTVEVEGFVDATSASPRDSSLPREPKLLYRDGRAMIDWDRRGYRFEERMLTDGGVWHVERRPDGVYGLILDQPTARYRFQYAAPKQWVPVGWRVGRLEMQIVDMQTGEILGRDVAIERYPGIVEQLWIRHFSSGRIACKGNAPKPPELRHLLYYYVLIPKKSS